LLVAALGCGGQNHSTAVAPAPTITRFVANDSVTRGQSGFLAWSVTGATSVSLDHGIGQVAGDGWWVTPDATTTYTLTATNNGATATATCTLAVYQPYAGMTASLASLPATGDIDGTGVDARFWLPDGLAMDRTGNLLVSDKGTSLSIRRMTPQGVVTTLASDLLDPNRNASSLAAGPDGTLYFISGSALYQVPPGGPAAVLAGSTTQSGSSDGIGGSALFSSPRDLAVAADGTIYVADTGNSTVRAVTPGGTVITLAGSPGQTGSVDGSGGSARFTWPTALAVTPAGNLVVGGALGGELRQVTPQGVVTTLGTDATVIPVGVGTLAAGPDGSIYIGGLNSIVKVSPQGAWSLLAGAESQPGLVNGPGGSARFSHISGLVVDAASNVYVADTTNMVIRMVTPGGAVTTCAGTRVYGIYGSYSPAVDASGNVFMPTSTNTLVKVSASGVVSTLAGVAGQGGSTDGPGSTALFGLPVAAAVDAAGNVYVADEANATIRKVDPSGNVTTLAGKAGQVGSADGLGDAARFNSPRALAVDAQGNVYVADTGNGTIRAITPGGLVRTVAGTAGAVGNLDGTGAAASFNTPMGITVDASGTLWVADTFNAAIRKITPGGVVTTQPFTLGSLGSAGALSNFCYPMGIALDAQGNLYVTNFHSSVASVLQVTPEGNASHVPIPGYLDTGLGGLAIAGGTIYLGSAWGVWTVLF
jgi:sugar lactone lactonase YvrE